VEYIDKVENIFVQVAYTFHPLFEACCLDSIDSIGLVFFSSDLCTVWTILE
jgi:hypothetical protein